MKQLLLTTLCLLTMVTGAHADTRFTRDDMSDFILHTYFSDDALGDVSFIIETATALVVLEPQAFEIIS